LYLFDEASGNLLDKVGSANVAAVNSPTFRYGVDGRLGVHYDATTDKHETLAINAPGSTSTIYGTVFSIASDLNSLQSIVGFLDSGAADSMAVYLFANTTPAYPSFLVKDTGSNALQLFLVPGTDWISAYPGLILMIAQVDRANTTARFSAYYGRTRTKIGESSGSIAGFAALSGVTAQYFGFGAIPALSGGNSNHYGFVISGAGAEGATRNDDLARSLGWR
jgi:hypothetical protein